MFELKHVRAALRDPKLRQALLNDCEIPLERFENFDLQDPASQEDIIEAVDSALQGWAPFQLYFSSPVEGLPDDAWIYGTKGVYIVHNQDGSVVFTRKKDAIRYASDISAVSWTIAEREGLNDS
jgi:hypothetical protein